MASVKIKAVKHKDKDVAQLFNQMLGADDSINMNICYPKYVNMKSYVNNILKTLELLYTGPVLKKYPQFEKNIQEIETFVKHSKEHTKELFPVDYTEFEWNLNLIEEEEKVRFGEIYNKLKSDKLIATCISICDNLIKYRKHIQDADNLCHKFIINMPGVDFSPFPFTDLNVKQLFILLSTDAYPSAGVPRNVNDTVTKISEQFIKLMMLVLNKLYNLTYKLYQAYSSPDIDVKEFAEVVMNNLREVKKRIPRCEKAFRKIEESVEMLQDNFGTYYRDFVETKNQTIIMENFVLDVAKNTRADGETTRQFQQIIKHYKQIAQHQIKNPQLKMLFDKVNDNFKQLERHSNINAAERQSDSDEEESEETSEEIRQREEAESELQKKKEEFNKKSVEEIMREAGFSETDIGQDGKKEGKKSRKK